ncbi:MAG: hypothetical protein OQK98_04820 [Gammaproteobacteria bacterium]|nr:hypothetical protein [Gammaproteobacteria bacterium]
MIQATLLNCRRNSKRANGSMPLNFFVPTIKLLVIAFLLLSVIHVHANSADNTVLIVYQKSQGFSQQLIEQLEVSLPKKGYLVSKMLLKPQQLDLQTINKQSLLIAIGSQATKTLLEANIDTPILSTLIPRHISNSLHAKYPNRKNWSRLLIDQPLDRQFHLITSLLGENKKTGILLGQYTKDLAKPLQDIAVKTSHKINIEEIENSDELTSSLKSLSNKSSVLLTLPDPVIYNKSSIRGILLLAYRNKLPIIGFSQAYVRAGAIAAIYSKPEQISEQINNISTSFFMNNNFEKKEHYPHSFSVALNKNIARSLGIKLPTSKTIIQQIKKAEMQ